MRRIIAALLLLVPGMSLARAEEPPYRRMLRGDDARKAAALEKQIDDLWAAAKFDEAVKPAQELRELRRRLQGEDHWEAADAARLVDTLRQAAGLTAAKRQALAQAPAITDRAALLRSRGKYTEAEPLLRQALAAYEAALGPRHLETSRGYNNLASILDSQGRAREAEPLYRRALAVRQEVLGKRHPDTGDSYNNLATNLQAQGRAREAEPLFRQALAVYEAALGPHHPDTARGSNNLAYNLQHQGLAREAEPLFRQALAVWERVLGPRHPDTAQGYNNLALDLQDQGRFQEAEPLLRQALATREAVLGPRHPDTAQGYNNLAANFQYQGRFQEAEPLYRRALAVCEGVLGPRHPNTARSYNNVAMNLQTQGRTREAEPLYRRALTIYEEVLGPRHQDTATTYNNLALNLQVQDRAREAEPLFRKALAAYEAALGPRHPNTARGYNNLAYNLDAQGRYVEAEPLVRRALAAYEETLGPRHPDTASASSNLAINLESQGRVKEAEPLFRKALAVHEEVLGPRHPDTARSSNSLASNLQAQGRSADAEPFWRAAAESAEAVRLRLAASSLDQATAFRIQPHLGLAVCRARLGRPREAWDAAEAGLARGLLDDLAARAGLPPDPDADRRDRERAARLGVLDRLLPPLLAAARLDERDRRRRDDLLRERSALDDAVAGATADRSRQAVLPLADVQERLAPDAALVFWLDVKGLGEHWGCVVRRAGPPNWVRLPGSGPHGAWTAEDNRLVRQLRDDLARGEPAAAECARRLAAQRLEPLAPHLAGVRRLVVVPAGRMAGIPLEALSDRYLVSYAPSGTVFARLRRKHRPLVEPTLLALGDPTFTLPESGPPPEPPDHGLYLSLVLPGASAARAGLRAGDILLSYGGTRLANRADLKVAEGGERVPVTVWRDGKLLDELRVVPGKLGVVISDDPPGVALRKRRERDLLADARSRGAGFAPLPGTRLEAIAIAGLLPQGKSTVLLGSKASEQELDALRAAGKLKQFRLLHLATHGTVDPISARFSALELARDRLPGLGEQARLAAAGKKVYTGRLSVQAIAESWELEADLVTLSACQTALGPDGGGEGLLGFSQVLLGRGARSLLLSLWKVDDTATALLMTRFYQNLLGKREGLKEPLPKAEALREAKHWLRTLSRSEAEALAGRLARGSVRAQEEPKGPVAPAAGLPLGDTPFAQPRYWAAFILIGDPD